MGPRPGPSYFGLYVGASSFTSFTGPTSISPFEPDIWACVLGLRVYSFKPYQLPPSPWPKRAQARAVPSNVL